MGKSLFGCKWDHANLVRGFQIAESARLMRPTQDSRFSMLVAKDRRKRPGDPNAVPGISVDQNDLHPIRTDTELVELACCPDGAPQSGKTATDDDNIVHRFLGHSSRILVYTPN